MNSYPDLMTQAALRYRADRIYDDWAPSRRRRARRRLTRLTDRTTPSTVDRTDVA
jgi:hypothetical protein